MEIDQFVKELGIPENGEYKDGSYTVALSGSNEYAAVYTKLDTSDLIYLDGGRTVFGEDGVELHYIGDKYDVDLVGDLANDEYTVTVKEGE